MRNILFYIFVLALVFTCHRSWCNHSGGHLTYTNIGTNTYLLRLTLYNECDGPSVSDSAIVCVSTATGAISFSTVLHQTGVPVELAPFPYIPAVVTSCNGGTFTGFTRFIYEGVIVLPAQYPDWLVSTSSDNMLSGGPSFNNYRPWVYSRIDNLNYPGNSSIIFTNDPVFFFCINQPAWESFAATDIDGDSIVYTFDNILTDTMICPASPVTTTFSFSQSLTSSTPYVIDNNAGWIHFNPFLIEIGSLCIKASEYRSHVLINETTFMQNMFSINDCVISGLNDDTYSGEVKMNYNGDLNQLHVTSGTAFGNLSLFVYDVEGRVILKESNSSIHGESEVSVQSLTSGVYFVTGNLRTDNRQINLKPFKFIKK